MKNKNLKILVDSNLQLTKRSINQTLHPSNISINFEKILNKVIKKQNRWMRSGTSKEAKFNTRF